FGGPGGGMMMMRMGQPGEILPAFLQDNLRVSDQQKKQIAELQKDVDGKIERILTEEQRTQLKRFKEAGFGGPGGRAGGPSGRPGGQMGPPGMGGPAMGMVQRVNGVELDPLVALDDPRKPLRGKVLAVPSLKAK